ncbi:MAG TPA: APH(3') family aminoglycoside O-phosphotransferase [Gemmatimonadaceae bacterium]|nr:APH(3') family aminoglycoside O-phosphotransferase [Gemmatimonadaceae bacterium]
MELSSEILERLKGFSLAPISLGESGAAVWRCSSMLSPVRYLKAASLSTALGLEGEAERLRWMRQNGLSVPVVVDYDCVDETEYLLLGEVAGAPASDARWTPSLPEVIRAIGGELARLHRASVASCPFDQRLGVQIGAARRRIDRGLVREDEFDEIRLGRGVEELFSELIASTPASEDVVLTHGDFCLPNIILRRAHDGSVEVAGLVDCGRAGRADRYQDLALAIRSIGGNFGEEWIAPFLNAYGLPALDEEKLRFYTLLDEFF